LKKVWKEDPMARKLGGLLLVAATAAFLYASGCGGGGVSSAGCAGLCDAAEVCNLELDKPYSRTECEYKCKVDYESNEYMGCKDEFEDYVDCNIDLKCSKWDNVEEQCDDEKETLDECVNDYLN